MNIRPAFRNGQFLGFAVEVNGEPVGKVHKQYKLAVMLRDELKQGATMNRKSMSWVAPGGVYQLRSAVRPGIMATRVSWLQRLMRRLFK